MRGVPEDAEFRVADVRRNAAGAGDSHISKVLSRLHDERLITFLARGRGARWKRLPGG